MFPTFKLLNPFLSSETDISPPPLLLFLLLNLENSRFKSWNVFLLDRIHSVTICVMLCYVMLCYVMLSYVMLCYSVRGKGKCKIRVRVNTSHIILSLFSHCTSAKTRSPALALGGLNDRMKSLYRTDRPFDENMSSTDLDSSLHRGSPEGEEVNE